MSDVIFDRKLELRISTASGQILDLSQFRVTFSIEAMDAEHPNSAVIRVFNLSPETAARITGEFQFVTLQAGYQSTDQFGVIFIGSIKQFRVGKVDAVTSFLDILASDGDVAYNNAFMVKTLAANHTPGDVINAAIASMNEAQQTANTNLPDITLTTDAPTGLIRAPRGKVMWGMARNVVRGASAQLGCSWSIQNGIMRLIPYNSFVRTGQVLQLSTFTGVVGVPTVTDEGIKIKMLLNPKITVGALVTIDENLVNKILYAKGALPVPYNQRTGLQTFANTAHDGLYRVLVAEHEGDIRGEPWYTHITCLLVDQATKIVVTKTD